MIIFTGNGFIILPRFEASEKNNARVKQHIQCQEPGIGYAQSGFAKLWQAELISQLSIEAASSSGAAL